MQPAPQERRNSRGRRAPGGSTGFNSFINLSYAHFSHKTNHHINYAECKMNLTKSVVAEFVDQEAHLQVVELELPSVGSNWVLLKVFACALVAPEEERTRRNLLKSPGGDENGFIHIGQDVAGVVKAVGTDVCSLQIGDRVVGIVPLDYKQSGCSSYVLLQEFDVVPIPVGVSFVEAAATVGDAVKVYTALHYLGRLNSGDTVLMIGGPTSLISIFVQLAHHWSARIITAVCSLAAKQHVSSLNLNSVYIIDAEPKGLKSKVMLETGEMGADIIINQLSTNQENIPSLHEIISCLSVGGRLVTSNPQTQMDPPHSRQLLLRCASVGYLFEQAWILSSAQQGRYQHILMDIMEKVATKTLRPMVEKTVSKLDEACEALKELQSSTQEGRVVLSMS